MRGIFFDHMSKDAQNEDCIQQEESPSKKEYIGKDVDTLHIEKILTKAEKYKDIEDITVYEGIDAVKDIRNIKTGLLMGKSEFFLLMCEYFSFELLRKESMLLGAFRRYIENNTDIRLCNPSPVMAIVFFFSGEEILKNWSIRNVCDLKKGFKTLKGGGSLFYKTHCQIRRGESQFKEGYFLKGMLIYVCLGGQIESLHLNMFMSTIENQEITDVHLKFFMFKIIIGSFFDLYGEVKQEIRYSPGVAQLVQRMLTELFKRKIFILLQDIKGQQSMQFLPLMNPWEILRICFNLSIDVSYKLHILTEAKSTKNPFILRDIAQELHKIYLVQKLPLSFLVDQNMFELSIMYGDPAYLAKLAEETSEILLDLEMPFCAPETKYIEKIASVWASMCREKVPNSVITKFIPFMFFRSEDVRNRERRIMGKAYKSILYDLADVLMIRIHKINIEDLSPADQMMVLALQPRKFLCKKPVNISISLLIDASEKIQEQYKRTGLLPSSFEKFFAVIGKFIETGNINDSINLLNLLVKFPIMDYVLSEINHLMDRLKTLLEKNVEIENIDLHWLKSLKMQSAKKSNLKSTFLKNVIDVYLIISKKQNKIDKKIPDILKKQIESNELDGDIGLKRALTRISCVHSKYKGPAEIPTAVIPIQAVTMPKEKVIPVNDLYISKREETFTIARFINAIIQNKQETKFSKYKTVYNTFEEYYNVFSPLLINETIMSINSERADTKKAPVEGNLINQSLSSEYTILHIRVNNSSVFTDKDIIDVYSKSDNFLYGRGIAEVDKSVYNEIHIKIPPVNLNTVTNVLLVPITTIVTQAREYKALIFLQELQIKKKILDPKHAAAYIEDTGPVSGLPEEILKVIQKQRDSLNPSQERAVKNALTHTLTLIQGPPGTGKTKTISALISQCTIRNWKVLVCAPSNAAVDMLVESILPWAKTTSNIKYVRIGDSTNSTVALVKKADIVFSTLSMSGSSIMNGMKYDVLVVDEACQATEPSTLIPLKVRPTRIVLVGDPKQLPPTVISGNADLAKTFFERVSETVTPYLLDIQYRMHSFISEFSSQQFYGGKIKNGIKREFCIPMAFVHVDGVEETANEIDISNKKEATLAAHLVSILSDHFSCLGIITPYKGQLSLIKSLTPKNNEKKVEISTVDGFQGQEKDCIILSAVRTKRLGFLSDTRRMNVAITRAKYSVFILGNKNLLKKHSPWKELIEYCQRYNRIYTPEDAISCLKRYKTPKSK